MTEVERIKLAVKTLVSLGVAKNQEELGKLMGYSNKSSFSQVLNGIVPMPDNFIDRLCKLDKRLRRAWIINEYGHILIKKEDSKQVYINEGIDIDKYEQEKEIERQKKYAYSNDFQYKELAEARLEIIEGLKREKSLADKLILSLEKENLSLKETNQDKSKSSHIVANVAG